MKRLISDGTGVDALLAVLRSRADDDAHAVRAVRFEVVRRVRDRKTRATHVTTGWQPLEVAAEHVTAAEIASVLAFSALLELYRLGQNGWANAYYSAADRSMLVSLHNFFFVSSDPGGLVSIDKPPLALWIPYESYRISHLMHHRDDRLTDPLDDPESYYWMPDAG